MTVAALLHFNGSDASTTFTDEAGHTFTGSGNAQLDTAVQKFGSASMLLDGGGDYIEAPSTADFGFGTGDFTIEGWARYNDNSSTRVIIDFRNSGGGGGQILFYSSSTELRVHASGTTRITGTTPATGSFVHWAICRASGTTRLFIDGTQQGSDYSDSNNYASAKCRIGASEDGTAGFDGWIDEVRIQTGVAEYTGSFTPPSGEFSFGGGGDRPRILGKLVNRGLLLEGLVA